MLVIALLGENTIDNYFFHILFEICLCKHLFLSLLN